MSHRAVMKKRVLCIVGFVVLTLIASRQLFAALPGARSGVDADSGNVYLGGNFIEFGIGQNGSSGQAKGEDKISGFYGRQNDGDSTAPGFLGDADGFNNGADLRIDYFLPGTEAEGWGVSLNNGSLVHGCNSHSSNNISPYAFVDASVGSVLRTTGTGSWNGLQIDHNISFAVNDKYVTYQVTLTNNSGSDMTQVSYMRSFDPDNTKDMGGSYTTVNKVVANIANDAKVIVQALSQAGDAYESAAGTQSLIRYYSTDAQAIPRFASGLMDTQAATVVNNPTAKDTTDTDDHGISIGFDIGALANGASTNFTYYVVMRSQSGSVTTLYETDYAFATSDFDYVDPEVSLDNVRIKSLPTDGTLFIDDNSDGVVDGGEAVGDEDLITAADLARLKYKPDAAWLGSDSFTFLANDAGSEITISVNTVEGVVAAFDDTATEANLDSRSINATLKGTTFTDATLDTANFTFTDAPAGMSIESITYTDDTHCTIHIAFNGDFDTDISTLLLTIADAEIDIASDISPLETLSVTATDDAESISLSDDGDIQEGSEDGEVITVTITGGTFASSLTAGNWTVSNLPAGVTKAGVGRAGSTVAAITLTGNASVDYDMDITNVSVECTTAEYDDSTEDGALSANTGVTFSAIDEDAATSTTTIASPGGGGSDECSFRLSPPSAEFNAAGGPGSFTVVTQMKCLWSAYATKSWITLSSGTDDTSGSGTVVYSVDANTAAATRYGLITAAGEEFMIIQGGSPDAPTTSVPGSTSIPGDTTTTVPGGVITTTTTIPSENTSTSSSTTTTAPFEGSADFVGSPLTGDAPLAVKFINTYESREAERAWDFGDNESSTGHHPEHIYRTPGSYSVTLNVTEEGWSDTMTKEDYITVTQAPELNAAFSAVPVQGISPLVVSFSDSSQGAVSGREWNFGDGSAPSSDENPVYTYDEPGVYTVSLTVSDESGDTDTLEKVNHITVSGLSPEADFDAAPREGSAPLAVSFADKTTGFAVNRTWHFGDGSRSSSARNPRHIYTEPGTYTVSLAVSAPGGSSTEVKTACITVHDTEQDDTKPLRRSIRGTVSGLDTGSADVLLTGPGVQRTAGTDEEGAYRFGGVLFGTYSITPQLSGAACEPPSREVTVLSENITGVDFEVYPAEPVLDVLYASPPLTPADNETPVTLLAKVSHLLGLEAIERVSADLSPIGGDADTALYDDGTNGDETAEDGVYSCRTTIAEGTDPGLHMLNVRAEDAYGYKTAGVLSACVSQTQNGTVEPCGTWEGSVEVERFTRELVITVDRGQTGAGELSLELFRPAGSEWRWWKTLSLTKKQTEYRIRNPRPGTWRYRISAPCTQAEEKRPSLSALSEAAEVSVDSVLTGVGSISGRVTDAETGRGVSNALIKAGAIRIRADADGYYRKTVPARTYRVRVRAFGRLRLRKTVVIEERKNTQQNLVVDRRFWYPDDTEAEDVSDSE